VRWIERRGRRHAHLSLASVPLDLAPILKGALFDRVETVVLTSATLAAGGEFTFLEERLGLDLEPSRVMVREVLPSPFDFAAQCLFGIPTICPTRGTTSRAMTRLWRACCSSWARPQTGDVLLVHEPRGAATHGGRRAGRIGRALAAAGSGGGTA